MVNTLHYPKKDEEGSGSYPIALLYTSLLAALFVGMTFYYRSEVLCLESQERFVSVDQTEQLYAYCSEQSEQADTFLIDNVPEYGPMLMQTGLECNDAVYVQFNMNVLAAPDSTNIISYDAIFSDNEAANIVSKEIHVPLHSFTGTSGASGEDFMLQTNNLCILHYSVCPSYLAAIFPPETLEIAKMDTFGTDNCLNMTYTSLGSQNGPNEDPPAFAVDELCPLMHMPQNAYTIVTCARRDLLESASLAIPLVSTAASILGLLLYKIEQQMCPAANNAVELQDSVQK